MLPEKKHFISFLFVSKCTIAICKYLFLLEFWMMRFKCAIGVLKTVFTLLINYIQMTHENNEYNTPEKQELKHNVNCHLALMFSH